MTYFIFITEQKLNFGGVSYNVKLYFIIGKCLQLIYKRFYKVFISRSKTVVLSHILSYHEINTSSFSWLNLRKTAFMI